MSRGRRAAAGAALAALGATPGARAAAQPAVARDSAVALLPPDTAGAGLLAAATRAAGRAVVGEAGTGPAGRLLRAALAAPHTLIIAPDTGLTLGRAVRSERTLVVVGGPVRVAARVAGDVVVLGELYLRPGADIAGRAVAIGGGAYGSTLARVGGDLLAYRTTRFVPRPNGDGTLALDARALRGAGPAVRLTLPGSYGLRLPDYTRVDGVAFGLGPELALDTGRVRVGLLATYRSQLGVVDPAVRAVAELTSRTVVELRAERGTFTNDAWARRDLINAIAFGATGADARNYYRADLLGATVARRYEVGGAVVEPLVGALTERSWSAARDSGASRPFTAFRRDDVREGARRPNPAVTGGRITSALAGVRAERDAGGVRGRAEARVEHALAVERAGRFTRATVDLSLARGEVGERRVLVFAHAALTAGRRTPSQRYAYLGGGPTLPTRFLLDQGGTQLVWGEARYVVPLPRLRLPRGRVSNVTFRVMAGAAGVDRLPALTPNLGLRLSAAGLRADYVFDPTGRTRGGRFSLGAGLR